MILIVDNYDSFSYNLYQVIGEISKNVVVIKNDELTVEQIDLLKPSHIILSPGPKRPKDAGICLELVNKLHKKYPILGVCLGHQSICEAFGAKITYAKEVMHGKRSRITVNNTTRLFKDIDEEIQVARYHSLCADKDTIPKELKVTATTCDGEIMSVEHVEFPVYGVQFHPESILTPDGKKIIKNFLEVKND